MKNILIFHFSILLLNVIPNEWVLFPTRSGGKITLYFSALQYSPTFQEPTNSTQPVLISVNMASQEFNHREWRDICWMMELSYLCGWIMVCGKWSRRRELEQQLNRASLEQVQIRGGTHQPGPIHTTLSRISKPELVSWHLYLKKYFLHEYWVLKVRINKNVDSFIRTKFPSPSLHTETWEIGTCCAKNQHLGTIYGYSNSSYIVQVKK